MCQKDPNLSQNSSKKKNKIHSLIHKTGFFAPPGTDDEVSSLATGGLKLAPRNGSSLT